MAKLKYPIGIQTFSKIIKRGYAYVDKTQYIETLLEQGQFIFLSRPRRFGKSLLLSTLEAYFEGKRESENFSLEDGLDLHLDTLLRGLEMIYGKEEKNITPSQRFRYLIEEAYRQTGQEVVILIDEYDKPLLDIEDNRQLFEKNQRILKSFIGNLKSMDRSIPWRNNDTESIQTGAPHFFAA